MHGGFEQQKYRGLQPAILRQWNIMGYVYIANQLDIMFEDIWDFRGVWNFPVMAILGQIMMITQWVEGDIYPIFRQIKVFADETINWKLASFLTGHMTWPSAIVIIFGTPSTTFAKWRSLKSCCLMCCHDISLWHNSMHSWRRQSSLQYPPVIWQWLRLPLSLIYRVLLLSIQMSIGISRL